MCSKNVLGVRYYVLCRNFFGWPAGDGFSVKESWGWRSGHFLLTLLIYDSLPSNQLDLQSWNICVHLPHLGLSSKNLLCGLFYGSVDRLGMFLHWWSYPTVIISKNIPRLSTLPKNKLHSRLDPSVVCFPFCCSCSSRMQFRLSLMIFPGLIQYWHFFRCRFAFCCWF